MLIRTLTLTLTLIALVVGQAAAPRAQEIVISPQFDDARPFHHGLARVRVGELWGLIDRTGNWAVTPRYTAIRPGAAGLFAATQPTGGQVLIDAANRAGNLGPYPEIGVITKDAIAVRSPAGVWEFIDRQGRIETDHQFQAISGREGPFIIAQDNQGWALFNRDIGPPIYRHIIDFEEDPIVRVGGVEEGHFVVQRKSGAQLAVIDDSTPEAFVHYTRDFKAVGRQSDGLTPVQRNNGSWAYVWTRLAPDFGGQLRREFRFAGRFDGLREFTEGLAAVKADGQWGYIGRGGRFVIPPRYDAAFPFHEGFAVVRKDGLRGFLYNDPDAGVRVYVAPQYEDVYRFSEGLAPVKTGGLWGYIASDLYTPPLAETAPRAILPGGAN